MSKTTVVITYLATKQVFSGFPFHDESGDGGIFSQSAAKPNCAPVFSGLGSENLA